MLSVSFCPFLLLLLTSLLLGHPCFNMQSSYSEMVCRASVLARARVFLTPLPSLCLPLMAVLLVALQGLLSSGSRNSFSGCLISSTVAASQVMLGVRCDDRRAGPAQAQCNQDHCQGTKKKVQIIRYKKKLFV
ncbi:hypothetical protein C1H46_020064 [Malus baccata]|uniref:Secreted protein n=1 Tax=Malus baccata TaxID=106549 RepID=A0A540M669_MALBA|nr:hypothetical protein C1H46_020064 [Malus baccata]